MRITTLLLSLFALALAAAGQTAPPPAQFLTVNYVHVPMDKAAQAEELMKTMLSKVERARLDDNEIEGWVVTKMLVPIGTDAKYNYITATFHSGPPELGRSQAQIEKGWTKAGLKHSVFLDRRNTLGVTLVKSEVWRTIEVMGSFEEGQLIRFDTKKVSQPQEYVRLERTLYKPYWAERIQSGALQGWGFYYVALPGGEDRPYSYATVQSFKDEKQMLGPPSVPARESWAKAAPGTDPYDLQKQAAAVSHTATLEVGRILMIVRRAGTASGGGR